MRIGLGVNFFMLVLFGCGIKKTVPPNETQNVQTLEDLKQLIADNCRYQYFKIGAYHKENSNEKFGLDTLKGKYIWYFNNEKKIITNAFLKEKYAVKHAFKQIDNVFPELKGAMTISVFSKASEVEILAVLKKANIQPSLIISPDEGDLAYFESEIDITDCDANRVASLLEKFDNIKLHYK